VIVAIEKMIDRKGKPGTLYGRSRLGLRQRTTLRPLRLSHRELSCKDLQPRLAQLVVLVGGLGRPHLFHSECNPA
jgi:hypothetical protein